MELRREACLEAPDNQVKISVSFLEVALDSPPRVRSFVVRMGRCLPGWAAPAICLIRRSSGIPLHHRKPRHRSEALLP
jgi:hypothetical protein